MTDKPLTFQGVPIVWDESFDDPTDPPRSRCYMINEEAAEAARKAGYTVVRVKVQKSDH